MEARDEEHHAQGRYADSLEDTQRTRLEAELVLSVKGVGKERGTRPEAGDIEQTAIF